MIAHSELNVISQPLVFLVVRVGLFNYYNNVRLSYTFYTINLLTVQGKPDLTIDAPLNTSPRQP